ncbi:MAG: PLP-dependent aminotransferase family protein [Rhizobiales bacterium]|nr:PLP-dependent aminotransferase family protein [Hyphomicrobiales bacterium]
MRYSLFHIEREKPLTLQAQIREMLVAAMMADQLPANSAVPSTRAMAKRLKVSRNTVMLAYHALAADGYLTARERSGFYVSEAARAVVTTPTAKRLVPDGAARPVTWADKLQLRPSRQNNIVKPGNWHDYPYPFIYGQVDAHLFPISAWRDCMRQSMSVKWLDAWTDDRFNADDPMLIEQIQQRILTRRGVMARPEEILVTMGAQNALYMLSHLLVRPDTPVVVEDPGYPDLRNMFALQTRDLRALPVDREGLVLDDLRDAKIVFTTPSHQFPTSVTMSMARRLALLDWAEKADAILIEDDYEYETNYRGEPTPALKSLDRSGRVVYVGSLSKSIMPGLRMGFLVAPAELVAELRAMRRLILRHPPGNNQRVVALFLSLGGHDALINRLHRAYLKRWQAMDAALERYFPGWAEAPVFGGTTFWCRGPQNFDAVALSREALRRGVVIEQGDVFFADPAAHRNYFRLSFSSIAEDKIAPGLRLLADAAQSIFPGGKFG